MGIMMNKYRDLAIMFALSTALTSFMDSIPVVQAGSSSSTSGESVSSSQPLWSYQVKPGAQVANSQSYLNGPLPAHHYPPGPGLPSIFEAFNGVLSQRQGALTSSPFLSILPIILIAAGGMLLLLPLLTMMMASPFGGGFGGGFNNGFGYPQAGLNKKRSLPDQLTRGGIYEILEHVSSTIDNLSKKYSQPPSRRAKAASNSNQEPLSTTDKLSSNIKPTPDQASSSNLTVEELANTSNGSASSLNVISSLRS